MINFFRKIRKKLADDNQFFKYARYAIGEILLVVIGILIALQVNKHQDYLEARSRECEYLKGLITDLTTEKMFLESYLEFDQEVINNAEDILQGYYDRAGFTIDTIFSKRLSILNNRSTFRKHNSTYRELLATGGLNLLLDQTLKQQIMLYFQTVDQYETVIRQNNEYIDNHFAPLALQVSTHYVPNHQLKWSQKILEKGYIKPIFNKPADFEFTFFKHITNYLNDPIQELELVNQIQYRYRISAVHLSIVDELLDSNLVLLEDLKKAINSCYRD